MREPTPREPDLIQVSIAAIDALARAHIGAWLTPSERATHDAFVIPKRRRDWLAGRVAAKTLIAQRHDLTGTDRFTRIAITPIADGPERGRPRYAVDDHAGPFDVSIAHCGDVAIAALGDHGERVGVDLEATIDAGPGFDDLAFSPTERGTLATLPTSARADHRTHLWTLKEALLKATGMGLRARLPDISVALSPSIAFTSPAPSRAGLFHIDALVGAWVVS